MAKWFSAMLLTRKRMKTSSDSERYSLYICEDNQMMTTVDMNKSYDRLVIDFPTTGFSN